MAVGALIRSYAGRVAWRRLPWPLLAGALVLTGVGAAFVWSSASRGMALKHLVFAGAGCVAFCAFALFDYRHARGVTLLFYLLGLAALAGLWTRLGITVNYARRWYDLGVFHAQPSEPMKLILVLALADYFSDRRRWERMRDLVPPLLMTGLAMLLIVVQPDFGTALMLAPVFFGVAFLAGVPLRNLLAVVAAGCLLLVAAWFTPGVVKPYQRNRVIGFINPAADPGSDAAYNAEQAMLAICAGDLNGQGWGRGVLNRLGRVPERHTDFIFPVVAEEWGFARTAPLIVLYLMLTVYMAHLAARSEEPFGRLIVGGVCVLFAVQSFLHMAISLRLAPITGLTLPLVSYGGSSLVTTYASFGLVASVRTHRSAVVFSGETPA